MRQPLGAVVAVNADAVALGYWQDRDPAEALVTAHLADALGYRELWLGEMVTYDVFALAATVGRDTRSIPLVLGPLSPVVRDPMMIAMGAASVAALSGRLTRVALGRSSPVVVAGWHGRSQGASLREAAEQLRVMSTGGRGPGGYRLRLDGFDPLLTVAAFGPAAVSVAASRADRMVINLCSVAQSAQLRSELDAALAVEGRPRIPLAAWVPAAVDPTDATLAQLRRAVVGYLAAPGYGEMFAAAGFPDLVALARSGAHPATVLEAVGDDVVAAVAIVGDETRCRDRIAEVRSAGVDEVVIVPATAGDDAGRRTLEALAPPSDFR